VQVPYQPELGDLMVTGLTAEAMATRASAKQSLRDAAGAYDLSVGRTADFAATPTAGPSHALAELRFKKEEALASSGALGPSAVAPGGLVLVRPFQWTPEIPGTKWLSSVRATGDSSMVETITSGPLPNASLQPLDNNIGQRTTPK
jgi:hypothetical protein